MVFKKVNFLPVTLYAKLKKVGLLDYKVFEDIFIKSYFFYKKYYEDSFHKFTNRYSQLFMNGHVFDIGANIGYTASVFVKKLTAEYRVFAFEPLPDNFRMLKKTLKQEIINKRVEAYNIAIGDVDGIATFWVNKRNHGDCRIVTPKFNGLLNKRELKIEVPIVRLDTFVEEKLPDCNIALIKMDVQGFELAVAKGMKNLFKRCPNMNMFIELCPCEMNELGFRIEEMISLFNENGYRPYLLNKDGSVTPVKYSVLIKKLGNELYCDIFLSKRDM